MTVTPETTEPTGSTAGKIVYTATVTVNGTEYTDTKEVVLPATGVTVSGTAVSFLGSDTSDIAKKVTITLTAEGADEPAYTTEVNANNAVYTIEGVAVGTYTLTVSKQSHVTRTYGITVANTDIEDFDVKIHLLGDINGDGDVDVTDVMRVNSHAKEQHPLIGYELDCGDVWKDGDIDVSDVMLVNSHAKEVNPLW